MIATISALEAIIKSAAKAISQQIDPQRVESPYCRARSAP